MKNAHVFSSVYDRLGIDLRDLGCLMIDTDSPVNYLSDALTPYVSPDPKKFWVKGLLENWHATVRYGFLSGVSADDIDLVLEHVEIPDTLKISGIDVFPSPYPDEKYDCLVARVEDSRLVDMNTALSVLPNVNTFPVYKAHITIGYFEQVPSNPDVTLLGEVKVKGLNYGHKMPRLEK